MTKSLVKEDIDKALKTRLDNAYETAKKANFQNVSSTIIEILAQHSAYSLYYAEGLKYKNIPDIIIKSIAKDPFMCARFYDEATHTHKINIKDIPDLIKRGTLAYRKTSVKESFLTKLSKLFEGNLDYFPKLKAFLKEKGFQEQDGKFCMSKELSKISNIQQQYGFEISAVEDGKLRIMWYANDHMKSSCKPIEAENEDQAIIIVGNLIEKFLNPKNNGLMGNLLK